MRKNLSQKNRKKSSIWITTDKEKEQEKLKGFCYHKVYIFGEYLLQ